MPVSFTTVMVWTLVVGTVHEEVWKVGLCEAIFVWTAFHTAYVLDRTCFSRMRRKHGWSMLTFHAGDAVLHHAPLVVALGSGAHPTSTHVLAALGAFWAWCGVATGGSLVLDRAYVVMPRAAWYLCEGVGGLCMFAYVSIR